MTDFEKIIEKYREESYSERDKGARFEHLMQAYLQNYPTYKNKLKRVWLWNEFPGRVSLGGQDTGIDLVAQTYEGDYWAIQCKCYAAETTIDKSDVDTFFSTSSRTFVDEYGQTQKFSFRLWIDTTHRGFTSNAYESFKNQTIPASRLGFNELQNSQIDWKELEKGITGDKLFTDKKTVREHQKTAIDKAHEYFKTHERGKLIMACGTGKTFTALKIAENETNGKGTILFLVPSIALLGQILRDWNYDASESLNAICICSDAEVSKVKRKKDDDTDGFSVTELAMPASTNVNEIKKQFAAIQKSKRKGMTVVFSTYQSIERIAEAQKQIGEDAFFDLIVCDEAHRTTGVTLSDKDESAFVRVHDGKFLKAKRRLYMTATPRIYSESAQTKARESDIMVCSMDDTALYGDEIYRIGFGEAVEKHLLSDYKVLVLTLSDDQITPALQQSIANKDSEIKTDDATKLIGCINALSKKTLLDSKLLKETDPEPMRRAVAFCQSIKISKAVKDAFNSCRDAYFETLSAEEKEEIVQVEADHVDGTMGATTRDLKLQWLKDTPSDSRECRILTNVRCLSEGVDVPSLDAVLFLSARNSQVDVVQSVGRVMRSAEGKRFGYIIIPVVVPADVKPEDALNDNERFKVVWTVLNALRAHDDRFNATVNKIELNKKNPDNILVGGTLFGGEEHAKKRTDKNGTEISESGDTEAITRNATIAKQLAMKFEELQGVIYARMVQKVGNKRYWSQWAADVAQIAERHIEQINKLIETNEKARKTFDTFLKGLRKNVNPSVSQSAAVEMLSQHIITQPVFDALFENYSFAQNNPMSKSLSNMIKLLNEQIDEEDHKSLERFYKSVQQRAEGIDNAKAKQTVIVELYDTFFRVAFPKTVEQLGIVYTPVEVVDFIIRSVEHVLNSDFKRSLSDENVNIIDPFTGTGTFITRLLQSGIIHPEDLQRKYTKEIKANEIVLLAYYIASINIENAYHDLACNASTENNDTSYIPFDGICLTDTFQLGEDEDSDKLFSDMFPQNSKRVIAQKRTPIHVVIGNPPYSVGQKSANDNAQNQKYEKLDSSIDKCYAKGSAATNKNSLYDTYIKAFRWATDRLDPKFGGIIGFITNSGWINGNAMDGFRKCIEKEFSSIYIFNLRGAIRGRSGNAAKMEGQNIFNIMTGVAITILVKQPNFKGKAKIHYYDIDEFLNRKDKLQVIKNFSDISNLPFKLLQPNEHGDWINLRNDKFSEFIPIQPEKKFDVRSKCWFCINSRGYETARDSWVYNFNGKTLINNVKNFISEYNNNIGLSNSDQLNYDETKISWSSNLINRVLRGTKILFDKNATQVSMYRPFMKMNVYTGEAIINRVGQMKEYFPTFQTKNLVICVSGVGVTKEFSCIITNIIPDLELIGKSQCFPLYYYEENKTQQKTLFDGEKTDDYTRREAVTDWILQQARERYGNRVIKEDIFYYVYGFLHSPEYRTAFSADLKKMLPRIPLVEKPQDFWAFSKVGRQLAELHLNYETIEPYKGVIVNYRAYEEPNYRVEKMRFVKKEDKTKIQYNNSIVIENIPLEAYEYVVNGKSAIEWIMERYAVTTDTKSGICNNPNDWADEHNDAKYIFNLLLRVINVSIQTVEIVKSLPKIKF